MIAHIYPRLMLWLRYCTTYYALRSLDPHLRADLGLENADLRDIAKRAAAAPCPINIYTLMRGRENAERSSPSRRAGSVVERNAASSHALQGTSPAVCKDGWQPDCHPSP